MGKRLALVLIAMLLAAFALASEPALGASRDAPCAGAVSDVTGAG